MPSVTYNGQSFAIDGRRFWVLGASIQYARVPEPLWIERIAAARQAGFNTIETACPWAIHEPRRGRFHFQGDADVRRFISACGSAGMRVVLRVGPYIGSGFDCGGLPGWLPETPGMAVREDNELFVEHVSRYFRKLLAEVSDLQVTTGGPILLVQSEHAWTCSNEEQAERYLHEITRFIRESGITVPIINANDLWQESPGTIETWRGYDDLLVHLRQLRTVQSNAPRLVSAFDPATVGTWGGSAAVSGGGSRSRARAGAAGSAKPPQQVLRHLAEILASGAQPIVSPFHGGTNFGFLGGRIAGLTEGFVTTTAALGAPLEEAGTRGEKYHALRRLVTFANHFGSVFAELDPDYQPIVMDPEDTAHERGTREAHNRASVVPLRGPQGRIAFVFGDGDRTAMNLVLDDGIRLPINLGDQAVGWYALDVDLHGSGRLDYANVCPWAIIDRSIVVFQGPADAPVYLSVDGTPLDVAVPQGDKPLVVDHKGLTIVICNQSQIDVTYHDESAVYVGIGGFDAHGGPLPVEGISKAWVIRKDANIQSLSFNGENAGGSRRKKAKRQAAAAIHLGHWAACPATEYVTGESPRYASLEGPETLSQCGAPLGYGWYRITLDVAGARFCHVPQAGDRLHLFLEGKPLRVFGVGPGADPRPFDLRLGKGGQTLVALADNLGRFSEGNDLAKPKGLFGHIYEVRSLRAPKPKAQVAKPVDPFELRGFIAGRAAGQLSDTRQAVWTLSHNRKMPLLIDVDGARASGAFVLNDQLVAYYAGATGACLDRILIDPKASKTLRKGKNVLRFAPDLRQTDAVEDIIKATTLYLCTTALSESSGWAFAKWEPPQASAFSAAAGEKPPRGQPCWWRAQFELNASQAHDEALWLNLATMSKGQAYINGQNLGRYFSATATGRPVGPQTRLYVPACWLRAGQSNELLVFDEHGFEPSRIRLAHGSGSWESEPR